MKKICFASSSGGHFEQLMMLKPMIDKYESIIVTEHTKYNIDITTNNIYYLYQINRKEIRFPFFFAFNCIKSLYIITKEKPDIVITTGALAIIPLCLIMKFMKKKVIYIESFAKVTSPTITGKIIYKFADRFYIQWESLRKFYPDAIYIGGIY